MIQAEGLGYRQFADSTVFSAQVRLPLSESRAYDMGMHAQETEWTADMAGALPDDGKRYEVLDGELFVTPSTARADRHRKRLIYQSQGVPEYWIVDLDELFREIPG